MLCDARGEHPVALCAACLADLPWLTTTCFQCAQPLPVAMPQCGACLNLRPAFHRTLALFAYDELIAHCVSAFKFHGRLAYGKLWGILMSRAIARVYQADSLPRCILPMPLHPDRLKTRGYNQALELSLPIARYLQLPLYKTACQRIKATLPQSQSTSSKKRLKNVKNAFVVRASLPAHVAIVDDVITTGATAHALSDALRKAGVQRVDVWCCARTVKRNNL